MLKLEFRAMEIDHCSDCGGVWLDSGEIDVLGEQAGAMRKELLSALDSDVAEREPSRKRHCPSCGMRLARARLAGLHVSADRCRFKHGLWFDRGELAVVAQAAGAEPANALARFLAEIEEQRRRRAEEGRGTPEA
jgi:Zn-finger nucleic acid-binding protein